MPLPFGGPVLEGEEGAAVAAAIMAAFAEAETVKGVVTEAASISSSSLDSLWLLVAGLLARICEWRGGARRKVAGMVSCDTESRSR